jgi:hypothetical protein
MRLEPCGETCRRRL